jgi:hypothetical protein
MAVAEAFALGLALYATLGAVFAIVFLIGGIQRVDSQARGAGIGFRLIILPGVAALWPLLLQRWLRGPFEPPEESNPHRKAALTGGS